jgi:DNA replication protein DnaC
MTNHAAKIIKLPLQDVNDIKAPSKTRRQASTDGLQPLARGLQFHDIGKRGAPPSTQQMAAAKPICERCKSPLDTYSYGWIKPLDEHGLPIWEQTERGVRNKLIPCPVCSPPALANIAIRDRNAQLDRAFGGSNIPPKMRRWTFASFPDGGDQNAFVQMQDFAEKLGQTSVYLYGDKGKGKTGLAISAAQAFLERNESVLYMPSLELYRRIRDKMFSKEIGGYQVDVLDLAFKVDCLILDEVGVGTMTPFVAGVLLELTETRRNNSNLYTVYTSNKNPLQLAQAFSADKDNIDEDAPGFRIAERIAEDFNILEVQGTKLRQSALSLYEK